MPRAEVRTIAIENLRLDPYNPRLRSAEEGSSQDELIAIFVDRFNLDEIATSILESGYVPLDPLLGCPSPEDTDAVIVREGNRRVATIKLLLEPQLAPERVRERWRAFAARLEGAARERLIEVDVGFYADCDDRELLTYMGFRHVTGVLGWPALEKASFIAILVARGMGYADIAARLGSKPAHVERHFVAYRIVRQAQGLDLAGADEAERQFGVLLRALQASGIAAFLGVDFPRDPARSESPVPADHLDRLAEFLAWTFGTADRPKILRESRDLTRWGRILQSADALRYLRLTPAPAFERAWAKSGGEAESVADALWSASYRLEETLPLLPEYLENEDVRDGVERCTRYFAQIVPLFSEIADKYRLSSDAGAA